MESRSLNFDGLGLGRELKKYAVFDSSCCKKLLQSLGSVFSLNLVTAMSFQQRDTQLTTLGLMVVGPNCDAHLADVCLLEEDLEHP